MIDILGFRDFVQSEDVDIAGTLLLDLKEAIENLDVHSIQFSDSILLYTEGTTGRDLRAIVTASVRLVGRFAALLIGLRAGIACGEFWHEGNVFVGKAMIRAYELEQSQDWLGGVLDPAIFGTADESTRDEIQALANDGLLVPYPAPIKGGSVGDLLCLGWPRDYVEKGPVELAQATAPWEVLRKQSNTNEFLRWYRQDVQDKYLKSA